MTTAVLVRISGQATVCSPLDKLCRRMQDGWQGELARPRFELEALERRVMLSGVPSSFPGFTQFTPYDLQAAPNGKFYAMGDVSTDPNGWQETIAIARFDADGTPDAGFGTNGIGTVTYTSSQLAAGWAVLPTPDGGFFVIGDVSSGRPGVIHFNSDGSVDTSFNSGNPVPIPLPNLSTILGESNSLSSVSVGLTSTDEISFVTTQENCLVQMFMRPDGSLDTSFGQNGFQVTSLGPDSPTSSYYIDNEEPTSDGGLIAYLDETQDGGETWPMTRLHFDPRGNLLSQDTVQLADNLNSNGPMVDFDGDGSALVFSDELSFIEKFDPRGNADPSFGKGGVVSTPLNGIFNVFAESNGKLLVQGGSIGNQIIMLNADGSVDTTFNHGQVEIGGGIALPVANGVTLLANNAPYDVDASATLAGVALTKVLPDGTEVQGQTVIYTPPAAPVASDTPPEASGIPPADLKMPSVASAGQSIFSTATELGTIDLQSSNDILGSN